MAKFLFSYRGGRMGTTPEEQAENMGRWMAWFGGIGPQLVDQGLPIVAAKSVAADGSATDADLAGMVGGYSIVSAATMEEAIALARGCPVLAGGGSVEVGQTMEMD